MRSQLPLNINDTITRFSKVLKAVCYFTDNPHHEVLNAEKDEKILDLNDKNQVSKFSEHL